MSSASRSPPPWDELNNPDDYTAALVRFAEAFDAQELRLDAPPRARGRASPVYGALLGAGALFPLFGLGVLLPLTA